MLDEKDLQMIGKLLSDSEARTAKLIGETEAKMTKALSETEAKMTKALSETEARLTEADKESESRMMAMMEAYFEPKFDLLAEGHQLIVQQTVKKEELEELREDMMTRLGILEAVVRRHDREIEKLKKAQ